MWFKDITFRIKSQCFVTFDLFDHPNLKFINLNQLLNSQFTGKRTKIICFLRKPSAKTEITPSKLNQLEWKNRECEGYVLTLEKMEEDILRKEAKFKLIQQLH